MEDQRNALSKAKIASLAIKQMHQVPIRPMLLLLADRRTSSASWHSPRVTPSQALPMEGTPFALMACGEARERGAFVIEKWVFQPL